MSKARKRFQSHFENVMGLRAGDARDEANSASVVLEPRIV